MRIGPYEVLEELGRGGMGAVYRARSWRARSPVPSSKRTATRAEEVALEATAAAPDDPRARGELADAWVLVARARIASGASPGDALDRARSFAPVDAREIAALGAR